VSRRGQEWHSSQVSGQIFVNGYTKFFVLEENEMRFRLLFLALCAGVIIGLIGCGGGAPPSGDLLKGAAKVDKIDLDRVLKILTETLDEMDLQMISKATDKELDQMAAQTASADKDKPAAGKTLDKEKEQAFLSKFAAKLNKAQLISEPIGVAMLPEGTIQGFVDLNNNGVKDGAAERELFKVQLDQQRNRILASDASNRYREHQYGFSPGGFFTGLLLGTMLNRQRTTGFDASKFGSIQTTPTSTGSGSAAPAARGPAAPAPGSTGTTKAAPGGTPRSTPAPSPAPSSARGLGGSRGFSVGK